MKTLSEQIRDLQKAIAEKRDLLVAATKALEDDASEETEGAVVEHTAELEKMQARLSTLEAAEKALGTKADPVKAPAVVTKQSKDKPTDNLLGQIALSVFESKVKSLSLESVAVMRFGEDSPLQTIIKAAQSPAMSNVAGYAQELTQIAYGQFMDLLREEAILPKAVPLMNQHNFDGATSIYVPMRAEGKRANAAFRAEGAPIPVKGVQFTSQSLTPKNMGVILTATQEMLKRSSIDLAAYFQGTIIADTAEYLDEVFLGNGPGSPIEPAGIQNAVPAGDQRVASGTGTSPDIVVDVKDMVGTMTTQKMGKPATTRWIMSANNWLTVSMALTATGALQFPSTAQGVFAGYTAITSSEIPDNVVLLVDFGQISAGFSLPQFEASTVATLHEEDTVPLPIATAGAPNVVAAPVRSLFQTNSWALRELLDADWKKMRVGGLVQVLTGVAWVG